MKRYTKLGLLVLTAGFLVSCSTLNNVNPFKGSPDKKEADAKEKAGRISMVSADEQLKADPDLVSSAVVLPDPSTVSSWSQTGGSASKVIGHVKAGDALEVDWTWSKAEGSGKNKALTVAPIAADGKIFIFDADQTVFAIDAKTGKTLWENELKSGNKKDRRAFGGGMAVAGNKLIVASGYGFVSAHDVNTGKQIWKQQMIAPMTGSPTISSDRVFVASNNNEFYALSLADGSINWSDQAIAESARVLSSPSAAAIDDFVVAPYSSGEVIAYLPSNGRRLWTDSLTRSGRFTPISAINDIASRPVLSNGLVFASSQSGVLAAIDGRSGTRIWTVPFGTTQSPVVVGEYVFAVGVDANLICVEAVTGKIVWVTQLEQYKSKKKKKKRISYSGPILASGKLVTLSSDGRLITFSPQTGKMLEEKSLVRTGRFGADAGFFIEPIAYDGRILALADSGKLFSIR